MRRLDTNSFIQRAVLIHGDCYLYDNVIYKDMSTKVEIICRKHGSFFQSPCNHLKGSGCLLCNKVDSRKLGTSDFISKSVALHGDKYSYENVVYKNSKTPVEIICSKHGSFYQKPEKHLMGHGCPLCAKNHKDTTESFIEKARKVHGDLYDYSKVEYVNQKTDVCIIDPLYGEFYQQPNSHLNGRGCPKRRCSKYRSSTQLRIGDFLCEKFGVDDVFFEHKTSDYPYYADYYVSSLDLYIEFNAFWTHGGHWFDARNLDDVSKLEQWSVKSLSSKSYLTAVETWSVTDLEKRNWAIDKGLNYLVFWDNNLSDFLKWYDSFDSTHILNNVV